MSFDVVNFKISDVHITSNLKITNSWVRLHTKLLSSISIVALVGLLPIHMSTHSQQHQHLACQRIKQILGLIKIQ